MNSRRSFLAMLGAVPFAPTTRPQFIVDSCTDTGLTKIHATSITTRYITPGSILVHRLHGFTKVYGNG